MPAGPASHVEVWKLAAHVEVWKLAAHFEVWKLAAHVEVWKLAAHVEVWKLAAHVEVWKWEVGGERRRLHHARRPGVIYHMPDLIHRDPMYRCRSHRGPSGCSSARRVVVLSPRPLSICREAGQGVPWVYLPVLCRRSARACGVAASTVGRHAVGRNPSRQVELVHHGGQQMC